MKLFDTNVFVYSRGMPHPYQDPCRMLLLDAEIRPGEYGVDVESLQELLDLYSRRGHRAFA